MTTTTSTLSSSVVPKPRLRLGRRRRTRWSKGGGMTLHLLLCLGPWMVLMVLMVLPPPAGAFHHHQLRPSAAAAAAASAKVVVVVVVDGVPPRRSFRNDDDKFVLFSTPDGDLDSIDEESDDRGRREGFVYATPEPFTSEADIAEAANNAVAIAIAAMSTNNANSRGDSRIELKTEVQNSFLQYALSIILGRALPDARDGLKPVHRRILYSMDQLSLVPSSPHRKCARVVGEVLGKYHPHGDVAVYDALVRMAQSFSTSYRLVDGHGNFGSVDADPAAAMRYTECRLTTLAVSALLHDVDEDTVDFAPNFDGNEHEPTVLPARLPFLLLNGSSGIAVGMATNIPPHNLREILMACGALVRQERMQQQLTATADGGGSEQQGPLPVTDADLCRMVPGPDFPTGGSIMGTANSRRLHTTGNGGIVVRAVTHIEQVVRPGGGQQKQKTTSSNNGSSAPASARTALVATELPYQVNKAALLEQVAALVNDRTLEGISDLRDESDRDGIRVVFELKRDAVPAVVLSNLYKKTRLQTVFSGNFVALMQGNNGERRNAGSGFTAPMEPSSATAPLTPQRFTLREALDYFLDFRFHTIRRRTAFQLKKVEARKHIVGGLLLALSRVDEVIALIRSLPDPAACREALMDDVAVGGLQLGLSKEQADSVLKLQLGQLTRLNQGKLDEEKADLESKSSDLQRLLQVDDAVYRLMLDEFDEMEQKYGDDRKTKILVDEGEVNEIDMVTNGRSVIVVTQGGYIKRMPLKTFESQGRGTRGKRGTSDSSVDDEVLHCTTCNDHDTLLMIAQNGLAYGLRAYQVPTGSRTAKGTPIPSVLPIGIGQVVTAVLPVTEFSKDEYIVLATKNGWIKKTPLDAFEKISNRGLTIATLDGDDKLQWCHKCTDGEDILIGSSRGMAARFEAAKLRPTGRTSRGVKAMKLREGDTIADMNVVNGANGDKEFVLCVTEQGYGKRVPTSEFRTTSRGAVGVIAIKFKASLEDQDRMSCFCIVHEDDEVLVITSKGIMVRQQVKAIPCQSRSATGAVLQKVDHSDFIASVSLVPTPEDDGIAD